MYRLTLGLSGSLFLALCMLHVVERNWQIAAFLGTVGVLAARSRSPQERQLQILAMALIFANVAAAFVALIFGGKTNDFYIFVVPNCRDRNSSHVHACFASEV
jgi:hypothetical protein